MVPERGNNARRLIGWVARNSAKSIQQERAWSSPSAAAGRLSSNTATLAYRAARAAMIVPASIKCSRMPSADVLTL